MKKTATTTTVHAIEPRHARWFFPLLLLLGLAQAGTALAAYDLLVSASSNRAAPMTLNGRTVSGNVHVFTSPDTGVSRVSFFLDGAATAYKTEGVRPFDLAGTAADGAAFPFNTASLTDGLHTLTATVLNSTGVTETASATFTVSNSTPPPAALAFSSGSASFSATAGSNPAAQSVALTSNNGSVASVSVADTASWLTVSPTNASAPGTLSLVVDTTGMAAGSYSGTVSATAPGYVGATLLVNLTVSAAPSGTYDLKLSTAANRASPVSLANATVSGNIFVFSSPDTGVSRVSFYLDGATTPIKTEGLAPFDLGGTASNGAALPFNTATLNDGSHSLRAVLELAAGGTQTVTTGFTVSNSAAPAPSLAFSPNSVTFSAVVGSNPAPQVVALSAINGSATAFSVSDSAAWLTASSASASTPGSVTLAVNTAGLTVGTYTASVTATAAGYTGASVAVTLTVTAAPSAYDLKMSKSSSRVTPVSLEGQTVSGQVYIFTAPDTNVRRVTFYLDGGATPFRTEGLGPFDFAGTAASGAAQAFSTATLADGNHVVTANVELTTGAVQTVTSQFNVSNNTSVPSFGSEDFNDGEYTGWTMFDDSLAVPSNWLVSSGKLLQTSEVGNYGTALQNVYHKGTYAIFDATRGLDNYRFQVTVTPQSDLGRDIGVMFRYVNNDNYYRFYISADDGGARLERKLGGVFTTLAKNARGYTANVPITITVEAKGPVVQVGVTGDDKLFGIYDSSLQTGAAALYCRHACAFDDVSVIPNSGATSLVIAKPEAFSVSTGTDISVSAVLLNKPAGSTAAVRFTLGDVPCDPQPASESSSAPGLFQAHCAASTGANVNALTANLILNGASSAFSDTNDGIGTSGDNYVALGDSITFGLGDDFNGDNSDADGWVQSTQGYEAPLTGALNQLNPQTPTIIFNSGFPGDRSSTVLNSRIDAALARYSDASRVLVMLGTNDIGTNVQIGEGCIGTACSGTFKGNMLNIVARIRAAGKKPIVARVPPRFGDSDTMLYASPATAAKNLKALEVNRVITDELGLAADEIGPDFYSAFLGAGTNRFSLFVDSVHPNAMGYSLMAQLWYNHFSGDTGMPFLLENMCVRQTNGGSCVNPSIYKQNVVGAGDPYYADSSFKITGYSDTSGNHSGALPGAIEGGIWVMTKNSDKSLSNSDYLTLNFSGAATVYVAYDDGGAKPSWLTNSFTATNMYLTTSNAAAPSMRLYQTTKSAGFSGITLSGNLAAGATGTPENFVVIVKPQ